MRVTATGVESIDKDLAAFKSKLATEVSIAMDSVGADMAQALQKQIQADVYDAYTPKGYERRSRNSGLGPALTDIDANMHVSNRGAGVTLTYLPSGEHANSKWHTADGNELIRRIENGTPAYDYYDPGNRPFWQNYTDEMVDNDRLYDFFEAAMKMQGEIVIGTGKEVIREAADGNY